MRGELDLQGTARGRGRLRRVAGLTLLATALGGFPAALAHQPGPAAPMEGAAGPVSSGPGNQTDPHLSGSLLVHTTVEATTSRVEYVDLATGQRGVVPDAGHRDSLPDVSGSLVVFRRVHTDVSTRSVMLFDAAAPENPPRELAPDPTVRRAFPSIGGTTVAFMQFVGNSSTESEICVADAAVPDTAAVCLTDDEVMSNRDPAVSPDGSTVAWSKCEPDGTGCDVYVVRRQPDGTWGTVLQLTDSTGEDILPDTDGRIVTYASNAAGDYDIWWEDVDGSNEHSLVVTDAPGSVETNPTISGGGISFEREALGDLNADLYVVRPEQGDLYRLTDTPATDETLNALSVLPDGTLRAAWAQPDGITPGHNDIHALVGRLGAPAGPEYATCLRYDQTRAHRAGSTAPLRLQLCDTAGTNLSSPEITLTATGLVKLDGSAATAFAEDSGNANPDQAFRYDAEFGGYVFNLSTRGLSRGTWALRFVVEGSPTVHELRFDVR